MDSSPWTPSTTNKNDSASSLSIFQGQNEKRTYVIFEPRHLTLRTRSNRSDELVSSRLRRHAAITPLEEKHPR